MTLQAEWQAGPRTPAWDALWGRILAEALTDPPLPGNMHRASDDHSTDGEVMQP